MPHYRNSSEIQSNYIISVLMTHANPIWITKLQNIITLFMSASCIEFSPLWILIVCGQ
jgi:hypothetical protein